MRLAQLLAALSKKGVTLHCDGEKLALDGNIGKLSANEIELLKSYKDEILSSNRGDSNIFDVESMPRETTYRAPISSHQKSMLLLESLTEQPYYNLPVAFKVSGAIDRARLQVAFATLIANNDILRTVYSNIDQQQYIQPIADFDLPCTQLGDEASLRSALHHEANYRFSLTDEWPIKAHLFELNNYCVLSINIHHIAADGVSAKIILETLSKAYGQGVDESIIEKPEAQYADFSAWQHTYLSSEHGEKARTYWQQLLNNVPSSHNFPTQFSRPGMMTVEGERWKQVVGETVSNRIKALAQEQGVSSFSMMQSLFACFLSRMSGSQDVIFGSVYANRGSDSVKQTVGMFANTIPFRFEFSHGDGLYDAIAQCRKLVENAKQYQYVPFEQIVELADVERQANHLPLIQIMLVAQDNALEQFELESCQVELLNNDQNVSKFDFSIHLYTKGSQFEFIWEYSTDLFSNAFIRKIAGYFEHFIDAIVTRPQDAFSAINLASNTASNSLMQDVFPDFNALPTLILNQALDKPDDIALTQGLKSLSYAQLAEETTRVASALIENKYAPSGRVGVYMDKSIDMVIAMLAIMRAGYVYVPLDPSYPTARIEQICCNAQLQCIVTGDLLFPTSKVSQNTDVISIEALRSENVVHEFPELIDSDIAYVLYTSGSTGTPKGVAVSHGSIFYSIQANKAIFEFSSFDTIPTVGSQAFGVSLLEILVPLLSGGTVEVITRDDVSLIPTFVAKTQNVTVLHAVPSLMGLWVDEVQRLGGACYPALRLLLVGGEPVSEALLKKIHAWRPDVEVRVLYGMTESSVVSSSYNPKHAASQSYCIGQPHPNVNYYVMNEYDALQPSGLSGELWVSGLSLATEYVDNAVQTNKHFVFEDSLGQRVYKTGDRVKRNLDGYFEFLGRLDNQISLRGVRIELGDIESCVNELRLVSRSVVHPQQINEDETVLVLYYTLRDDHDEARALIDIKAHLSEQLPAAMRPTLFCYLESLPLNANGKIDRKSLPIPCLESEYVAPNTTTEEALQRLWGELFEDPMISVEGNFFELGGHSLLASRLIAKANELFQIELQISAFFAAPTIRLCAEKVDLELDKNRLHLLKTNAVEHCDGEELIF
ncbi:non-ribosomal peptide synthetase [Pseudoalteromonas citrea]|uniref:Non-ribosomal peptide synthetase n=1 Tax=Pseudoalteromonas citrea TaxID=43655 RepID=A0A5S3XNK0_9GAMM|nr:non-ribosomal peptide synthetase [Pseudoalteromonas citrea]TMP43895.1 non-ribosomal peptide synthetase [Pseudoalteromonas citrea]TMP58546.1 non-ribosomal peptide synthetase [Pseudoalteromonas citrea]